MILTTISKDAPMFGQGKELGKDYFEIFEGVKMFFYDRDSVKEEFGEYGLMEISEVVEPHKNMPDKTPFKFLMIKCQKN